MFIYVVKKILRTFFKSIGQYNKVLIHFYFSEQSLLKISTLFCRKPKARNVVDFVKEYLPEEYIVSQLKVPIRYTSKIQEHLKVPKFRDIILNKRGVESDLNTKLMRSSETLKNGTEGSDVYSVNSQSQTNLPLSLKSCFKEFVSDPQIGKCEGVLIILNIYINETFFLNNDKFLCKCLRSRTVYHSILDSALKAIGRPAPLFLTKGI